MAATTAASLLAAHYCDTCSIPPGLYFRVTLLVLLKTLNGEAVSTNINTLMSEANCLCIPDGLVPMATVAAAIAISQGGLGGGVTYGTSNPTTAPASDSGWYYRTDTGALWIWNSATDSWDPVIA